MELYIFARFHVRDGREQDASAVLKAQVAATRAEPGCLAINVFSSTRDPRLFFIHSRWKDEAAFDVHAELPDTRRFVEQMEALIDHPFDATRSRVIG